MPTRLAKTKSQPSKSRTQSNTKSQQPFKSNANVQSKPNSKSRVQSKTQNSRSLPVQIKSTTISNQTPSVGQGATINKPKPKWTPGKNQPVKKMTRMKPKDLPDLMNWVNSIGLSRRLSFIPRDFSDGVLVAEIVKHFIPSAVDLHNYSPANGRINKMQNWNILNRKVFPQLGFQLKPQRMEEISVPKRFSKLERKAKVYPIEQLLFQLRQSIGEINPQVDDYKSRPPPSRSKIQLPVKLIRPFSRQPMTEIMQKIEREAGAKYGAYKGNPIVWDFLPELNAQADLELARVGISKQKYAKIKCGGWMVNKNVDKLDVEGKDNCGDHSFVSTIPEGTCLDKKPSQCPSQVSACGVSSCPTKLELCSRNIFKSNRSKATQVAYLRGHLHSSGSNLNSDEQTICRPQLKEQPC